MGTYILGYVCLSPVVAVVIGKGLRRLRKQRRIEREYDYD